MNTNSVMNAIKGTFLKGTLQHSEERTTEAAWVVGNLFTEWIIKQLA